MKSSIQVVSHLSARRNDAVEWHKRGSLWEQRLGHIARITLKHVKEQIK
jgi:hypothetical protein